MRNFEQVNSEFVKWADETFTHSTPETIVNHLKREVFELADDNSNSLEIADCQMLLMHLAHKHGIDLADAVQSKLWINKHRTWGEPDSEGVVEHISSGKNYVALIEQTIAKYPKTTAFAGALGILASLIWGIILLIIW